MHFFGTRPQRPTDEPVEPRRPSRQKTKSVDHRFEKPSDYHAHHPCLSLPSGALGRYEPPCHDDYLAPTVDYDQPYQPLRPAYGRQHQRWASTSTLEVGDQQRAGVWHQPQQYAQPCPPSCPTSSGRNDCTIARTMNQGAAFCDGIAANLMEIISKADGDAPVQDELERATRELDMDDRRGGASSRSVGSSPERATAKGTKSPNNLVNFQKTWMYLNSRLPPYMAPWHVFLPTWTLVCRAAQASIDVYKRPTADERSYYTAADPKQGTKAMVVRSQPIDGRKLVTIAVRGSKWNLVDWTVNFAINPTEPFGFLDDPGNACHAGFLEVARAMLPTVAALLRQMVKDDSSIASGSLLFTGHSAGGAVASLLYAHMLARTVESELTVLAGLFRRVHCVTFGAPPVSLLPLQVPRRSPHDRNQFLSFINEGDLVVRADRAYLLSLIKLFTAPAPATKSNRSRLRKKLTQEHLKGAAIGTPSGAAPYWPVPEALLSNAGHLVLLRETPYTANHAPEAVPISDQQLRNVVFGDPAMHPMVLYKRRVDQLAFAAVSGNEPG